MSIDFQRIANAARPHMPELAARWLPAGKRDGIYWRCGNVSGEPGQSLAVTITGPCAGRFYDFADGGQTRGSDAIALAAMVFNISNVEAAKRIAHALGIEAEARR